MHNCLFRAEDILGNIVGFLTTVIGIFQMTLFRQVNVTWSQLRHLLRRKNIGAPDSQDYTQLDGVVDESFNEGSTLFGNHQNDDDRVIDANTKRSRSEPNGHLGYGQTNNDASDSTQVQLSQMMNA